MSALEHYIYTILYRITDEKCSTAAIKLLVKLFHCADASIYALCLKKRVLPKFGDNFVKSRPISKILSLLERELNLKQKYVALVSNFLKQLIAVP